MSFIGNNPTTSNKKEQMRLSPLAFFGLGILEGLLVGAQRVLSLSLWRVGITEIPLYLLLSNVVISLLSRQEALHLCVLVLPNLLLDQLLLRLLKGDGLGERR